MERHMDCGVNKIDLIVKPVETDEELRLANDLMAKAHWPDYFAALHWMETCGAGYPGFQREHTRIALWRNELAGALRLTTETVRLGEARLRTGGLGWITTEGRHRQKGVCRALMLDAFKYMPAHNYHVAMLFGIPNFYHRFGFATTLSDYTITMELEDALTASRGIHRAREAKPGDIPVIQKIHNANDTDVSCSLIRSSAHVTNKWDHRCKGMRVLTDDKGKVVGYFIARKTGDHLAVEEVGVADATLCDAVLDACAQRAGEETVGRIQFMVPPRHVFARFLLQFKTTHHMHIVRDSGGMMAFVNLEETLESLIPEWESLLAESNLFDRRVEVTLLVDGAHYRLRANRGAMDVTPYAGINKVSLSAADLMHLVTGYFYVEDILAKRRRMITAEARALLEVTFPKRDPYVWQFDRF
jgi:predicted acetyltransferase